MTKTDILNSITGAFYKTKFALKKHSPEILLVSGIIGTVAAAVIACVETTKLEPVVEKANEQLKEVKETDPDNKKAITAVYVRTGLEVAKLYGPSVVLAGASITAILASHNMMHKRNVALSAAYATVDNAFKKYRERVIDRFGEQVDEEIRHGVKKEKILEQVTDPDTGEVKTVEKEVIKRDDSMPSPYAKWFDASCETNTSDPEYNLNFLRIQQTYANDLLHLRGYLFLNEVYQLLGIPKTKAGQVVGWLYDKKNGTGDAYVDFGIYNSKDPHSRSFVDGLEDYILLDFNVQGDITNEFEKGNFKD